MGEVSGENSSWYPSKKLNYAVGIALACFVANSSSPFLHDPGGFTGTLLVQLLFIFCLPLGIAGFVSYKAKNPFRYGWTLFFSIIAFAMLAFHIAHQSR